jgi:prepilin-type processing-associated H-X9-DG protein
LAQVGLGQAQSSYYYRHGDNTSLSDSAANPFVPTHLSLDNLGVNRNGVPIRALAIDTQFLCSPALAPYNVLPATHHRQLYCTILFADGHTEARLNTNGRFTVTLGDNIDPTVIFGNILSVFEQADP